MVFGLPFFLKLGAPKFASHMAILSTMPMKLKFVLTICKLSSLNDVAKSRNNEGIA